MLDILLFFHRIWEIVLYVIVWFALQWAIVTWKYRGIDKNLDEHDDYHPGQYPG